MRDYFSESMILLKERTVEAMRSTLLVLASPIVLFFVVSVLDQPAIRPEKEVFAAVGILIMAAPYVYLVVTMHRLALALRSEIVWTWTLLMLLPPLSLVVPLVLLWTARARLKQAGMTTGVLG